MLIVFALTSMIHNNHSLLYVTYSWSFRHRLVRYYWYNQYEKPMIAAGNRSGQKIAWTNIICDKQLVSSHEAMKPLRIQLAANLLAHHLLSTTATSNRWQNQHFQRESTWLDFSDVLNILGRPFHLTVVLKLQQQRCRAFLASVHSVLRTTLFLCTMKRMNMIPSPKKAVTSHKDKTRDRGCKKSKIKTT